MKIDKINLEKGEEFKIFPFKVPDGFHYIEVGCDNKGLYLDYGGKKHSIEKIYKLL